MTIKQADELIRDIGRKEFAINNRANITGAEDTFRVAAYQLRKDLQDEIYQSLIAAGKQTEAEQYLALNQEMSSRIDTKNIIESMKKNPELGGAITSHLVGLASGIIGQNPLFYIGGRVLSKLTNEKYAGYKFAKQTQDPILSELGRIRNDKILSKIKEFPTSSIVNESRNLKDRLRDTITPRVIDKEVSAKKLSDMLEFKTPKKSKIDKLSNAISEKKSVPTMVTNAMKITLKDLGYNKEQIARMKPVEAWKIINKKK